MNSFKINKIYKVTLYNSNSYKVKIQNNNNFKINKIISTLIFYSSRLL